MNTEIQKWIELYKINFFQPKTKDDRNEMKEPIIINKVVYEKVKQDLMNNKWIEINWELYNPYTIDCIKKFKMDENINSVLSLESYAVQDKVKTYMKYDKIDTTLQRLNSMIKKAREELKCNISLK